MFYSFRADDSLSGKHRLVLFTISNVELEDILDAIQAYCENNSPPDGIELIVPDFNASRCSEVTASEAFRSRMPAISRQLNTPIVEIIGFNVSGLDGQKKRFAEIVRIGLLMLYRRHNGLIQATSGHHYIKPSLKHCSAFLRTGNVMIDGPEIEFIAACCLPSVPRELKRIYCDTGAIHPVAYAIIRLLASFSDSRQSCAVTSFGSYRQLRDVRFVDASKSLVLISASTSGELARQLRDVEPRFRKEQILTIYYLGDNAADETHVCDLLFHPERNPNGFERIESYSPDACPMCREDSTAVPMSGDHFLPEGLTVLPLLINAADAPNRLSRFLEPLVGRSLIRANYVDPRSSSTSNDVFFDLGAAYSDDEFLGVKRWCSRFNSFVTHSVSLDTRRIVCLDDPASISLAQRIKRYCLSHSKEIPIVSARDLMSDIKQHTQTEGATLVVASAISTGRQLLGVAQTLRYAQVSGAINYAIGLVRTCDKEILRDVKSHLTYGDHGPSEHGFHVLDQYFVPSRRPGKMNSWQREKRLLSELTTKLPRRLTDRLASIDLAASSSVCGLLDNLFLPSICGVDLKLRPSFAFWEFEYKSAKISQGDVYATISLILHALRKSERGSRSLGQFDHVRRVISPRCFERFNDGIIQASFLRAAYPSELDYSIDDSSSEEMQDVLRTLFHHRRSEIGEAAFEFLVALATKQLRLSHTYVRALYDEFADAEEDEVWKFYWRCIEKQVLGE